MTDLDGDRYAHEDTSTWCVSHELVLTCRHLEVDGGVYRLHRRTRSPAGLNQYLGRKNPWHIGR